MIGKGDDAEVWVDAPHNDGGHEWEVVEFRGVSEGTCMPHAPQSLWKGGSRIGGEGRTGRAITFHAEEGVVNVNSVHPDMPDISSPPLILDICVPHI